MASVREDFLDPRTISSSPDSFNTILVQNRVARHERQIFHQRLSDDEAVKRVTVNQWEFSNLCCVFNGDRQYFEAIFFKRGFKKNIERDREPIISPTHFDGNFPEAGGAYEGICRPKPYGVMRTRAKLWVLQHKPQHRMSIQKNAHM